LEGRHEVTYEGIPQRIFTKRKRKTGNTSDMMEGFCFVISITGLNRPNAGKVTDEKIFEVEVFLNQWFLHISHTCAWIS
jgi:hypothetical protein